MARKKVKTGKKTARPVVKKRRGSDYGTDLAALFDQLEPLARDIQEASGQAKTPKEKPASKKTTAHTEPPKTKTRDYGCFTPPPMSGPMPGMPPELTQFWQSLMNNPQRYVDLQMELVQNWMAICQESMKKFLGEKGEDLYTPDKSDRRFRDPAWHESAIFDFIKQSYLMTSQWMQKAVRNTEGLKPKEQARIDFMTRQFVDAMAPNNFIMTNPEVIRTTLDTGGQNLVRGLENLMEDLERGKGKLAISKTDYKAFEVGKNLAITPGKVVYQNDLMQLIQYTPTTPKVSSLPLLIVPPWINKYYILDMRPDNSFVKWAVDQGLTTFVVSWVNPDAKLAGKSFASYMKEGLFDALDAIEEICGTSKTNVVGYCIGGTLLATALAYMTARGQEDRIATATFLTTLIDFSNAGDLSLFTGDDQIEALETQMKEKGFLEAGTLQNAFSMLRANDLIWSFVVNNYLLGKEPFPFDLLYWNDDSTNMPAAMHTFYLKNMYRDNKLCQPGGIKIESTPIDVRSIKVPAYFLSTKEDHIAPWKATYEGARLFGGPVHFTLAASGHVAGVVNPPASNKYSYAVATHEKTPLPADSDDWQSKTTLHDGSWWPHWAAWIKTQSGPQVPARDPTKGPFKPLEDAPGSYVRRHFWDEEPA